MVNVLAVSSSCLHCCYGCTEGLLLTLKEKVRVRSLKEHFGYGMFKHFYESSSSGHENLWSEWKKSDFKKYVYGVMILLSQGFCRNLMACQRLYHTAHLIYLIYYAQCYRACAT